MRREASPGPDGDPEQNCLPLDPYHHDPSLQHECSGLPRHQPLRSSVIQIRNVCFRSRRHLTQDWVRCETR